MNKKGVVIAYWASTKMQFVESLDELAFMKKFENKFVQISHHKDWFAENKSYWKNFIHLSGIFLKIVRDGKGKTVCIFGTNACRLLFPFSFLFKKTFFIFNEMPCVEKSEIIYFYDKFIFRLSSKTYLSSQLRSDFVKKAYQLSVGSGVVENIPIGLKNLQYKSNRRNGVIFCGSITPKRFNESYLEAFKTIHNLEGKKISVYGSILKNVSKSFEKHVSYFGEKSHGEVIRIMKKYKFGLLAYYTEEINYNLCAPIKVFEYIAQGCQVISINKNLGLLKIAKKYPDLVIFLQDIKGRSKFNSKAFKIQRTNFLANAFINNKKFASTVIDACE